VAWGPHMYPDTLMPIARRQLEKKLAAIAPGRTAGERLSEVVDEPLRNVKKAVCASVRGLYPPLAAAFRAFRRVDFPARLNRLLDRGISGAVARRTLLLGALFLHVSLSGRRGGGVVVHGQDLPAYRARCGVPRSTLSYHRAGAHAEFGGRPASPFRRKSGPPALSLRPSRSVAKAASNLRRTGTNTQASSVSNARHYVE
jgi:hypothetical protein